MHFPQLSDWSHLTKDDIEKRDYEKNIRKNAFSKIQKTPM